MLRIVSMAATALALLAGANLAAGAQESKEQLLKGKAAFGGWPWYYIGANQDPRHKGARTDLKDKVSLPDVLMQAHSAPLQIAFYDGDNFPEGYKGSAFVTFHGSWNRALRTATRSSASCSIEQESQPANTRTS